MNFVENFVIFARIIKKYISAHSDRGLYEGVTDSPSSGKRIATGWMTTL
jgi:hypothetical protein